jgi:hypothetical protein
MKLDSLLHMNLELVDIAWPKVPNQHDTRGRAGLWSSFDEENHSPVKYFHSSM